MVKLLNNVKQLLIGIQIKHLYLKFKSYEV